MELPRGSKFKVKVNPALEWEDSTFLLAHLYDSINRLICVQVERGRGKKLADSDRPKPIYKPGQKDNLKNKNTYGINSPFTAEERVELLELFKHGN